MNTCPGWVKLACDRLDARTDDAWDADGEMDDDYVRGTPLGQLVSAFLDQSSDAECQLIWLLMFSVRRVLPCWQLDCDTSEPIETVDALRLLLLGEQMADLSPYTEAAKPSHSGVPILDCRQGTPSCVSAAAADAAKYVTTRNSLLAIYSLSSADMACDQSGLSDNYRRWFVQIAIPAAYSMREQTSEEQMAFSR